MKSFYLEPCTRKPKKCAQVPRALNIELTINSLVVIRFSLRMPQQDSKFYGGPVCFTECWQISLG